MKTAKIITTALSNLNYCLLVKNGVMAGVLSKDVDKYVPTSSKRLHKPVWITNNRVKIS